jgi:uncharacterized protein (TIGR00290 family)
MRRIALSWSSGKDSAWALQVLRQTPGVEVAALITTFNSEAGRVAMHAVRRGLVEEQAARTGVPLWPVELPWPCANSVYESRMEDVCRRAVAAGLEAIAFGDLFLRDIREYRERQLRLTGLEPLFPLWELPTSELAVRMIGCGVRAKVTCVDPKQLDRGFAGRDFDSAFLSGLPPAVDPCGENGEFHTFVYDGPMFSSPIPVQTGEIVEREGFVFADLIQPRPGRAASEAG